MKQLIILIFTFITVGSSAQNIVLNDTLDVYPEIKPESGVMILRIPVNFDQAVLLDNIPASLKDLTIQQIDLVYTTYKQNPDFDQEVLNRKRIRRLLKELPEARDPLINWRIIGQSKARDAEEAKELFHGFVIYYRPKPTKESIEKEIDYIDRMLGFKDEGSTNKERAAESVGEDPSSKEKSGAIEEIEKPEETSANKAVSEGITTNPMIEMLRFPPMENDCYTAITGTRKASMDRFKLFSDSVMRDPMIKRMSWTSNKGPGKHTYHYVYYLIKEDCDSSLIYVPDWLNGADYNAVEATFKRHPDWQNSLVVMDVTGSMSPYIAKTMSWVKATQDSSQVSAFVFFNDGDMTPDSRKKTGTVGGIYGARNTAFEPVYKQMKTTMNNGGGGDCPENNVEATIKGINDYPDCDEVIMVADNWATPRDLSLVKQLDRPVHVIVCGSFFGLNEAYIQLAYDTRGSVHTIEEDLDARDINPGAQFRVGKNYFTLVNGKIVRAEHK